MKKTIKILMLLCTCILMCSMLLTACSGDGMSDHTTSGNATSGSTTSGGTTSDSTTESTQSSSTEDTKPNVHTHVFGEWTTVKEPTCTDDGSKERVCACGEKENEKIAAKRHTPGAAATCTEKQICTVCNAELAVALGHNGEWVVVKEATKTEDGLKEKTCATCSAKESEVLYATGSLGLRYGDWTGHGYAVIGIGTCTDTDVVIPSVYNGETVASIGSSAFIDCNSLTSIEIPDSVTNIDINAFNGCSSLTSIEIPDGVTSIGISAFQGCSSLTSIEIPDSVTSIGYQAFFGCSSLTSIEIPDGVTSIGNNAFQSCRSLTSIEISDSLTSIGYQAFMGCSSLTSIEIPDSVTSIGNNAFNGCRSLMSIEIPDGVTSIDSGTFQSCRSLTSIEIPDSVTSIGNSAFYDCSSLTSIEIPGGVTSIGNNAFRGCSSLMSIEIPDGVTSIGNSAFYDCSSLTSIEIPDGVTGIGDNAFFSCGSLTSIEIPEGVTSIGNNAFNGCIKLVEVINKSKFDIVRGSSDQGSVARYALEVHDGESKIVHQDGYFFYTYDGVNYLVGYAGDEKEIVLPENYNGEAYQINQYAFYHCDDLTSVVIPDGVTSIGANAFGFCRKLVEVINKSNLKISKGSYNYGFVAYYALEVHDGESKIVNQDGYLFYTCDGVNYLVRYAGNEKEIVLPENYNGEAYQINQYAFYGCDGLTSVVIPNSVTSIGTYAFGYCYKLNDIQYTGTTAEWKSVSKGDNWKYTVPATKVVCSDDEVLI